MTGSSAAENGKTPDNADTGKEESATTSSNMEDQHEGNERSDQTQEVLSLGLARYLTASEKLYLALALSRILRSNIVVCLQRNLSLDVLGLDALCDGGTSPFLYSGMAGNGQLLTKHLTHADEQKDRPNWPYYTRFIASRRPTSVPTLDRSSYLKRPSMWWVVRWRRSCPSCVSITPSS
jgi:hypothetical protein